MGLPAVIYKPFPCSPNIPRGLSLYITPVNPPGGGGGTLGISGWGRAAGTLGPLTYTRASSAEFCYPILEQTPQIPPILE